MEHQHKKPQVRLHVDTDIYKAGYELFDVVVEAIRQMRKDFKRTLGDKLRDECIEILTLIFDVNTSPGPKARVRYLKRIIRRVTKLELLLRLAKDKRLIAASHHAKAIALTQSVGRQASGCTLVGAQFRKARLIVASTPCEQFSTWGMRMFHPNPPWPELGIELFQAAQRIGEESGVLYILENVRGAVEFVGPHPKVRTILFVGYRRARIDADGCFHSA